MSKIFDAIQRGHGELSDTILASLPSAGAADPAPALLPASSNGTQHQVDRTEAPASQPGYKVVRLSPADSLLTVSNVRNVAGEQVRILRTKIIQHVRRPRILLVSSAAAGDGKTMLAINLAAALSLRGQHDVLLLDGDFRRPSVALQLGLTPNPGTADILEHTCSFQDAVVRSEQFPYMCVLPAGEARQNPAELLDSDDWRMLCTKIRETFRYVVIDSPPVSAVADYDLLQSGADGVILTASPDHTPRKLLFKAVERIPTEKLLGVVLNRVPKWFLFKSFGHEYYKYQADEPAKVRPTKDSIGLTDRGPEV